MPPPRDFAVLSGRIRSTGGQWIDVCTVLIGQADGRTYKAVEQLPIRALRAVTLQQRCVTAQAQRGRRRGL